MNYIIYTRKSTDTEDRQVLSLDSQERELLEIADKHNLKVVKTFRESMSAKSAGRPIFNEMMALVESGKARGILCWKLDRLARNFVDGGKVIDSLQRGAIQEIRTYESTHLPSDNVLLLAVQLGMANQYIRDLSVNVKRGNREKLSRGEWPNHAPFGYLNDKATKTVIVDPVRSPYVVRAFDLYLIGSYSFKNISDILYQEGLRTKSGKKVLRGHIQKIITSVFYTGIMKREGKYYNGNHQPLISKDTFDKAQGLSGNRSRPRPQKLFFPLRGFLTCESCGCMLTASLKKGHHYYYCTNGKQKCDEHKSYLRENTLYQSIAEILGSLDFTERKIELMYQAAKARSGGDTEYVQKALETLQTQLESLKTKEMKLLDAFLAEQIPKELYDQKTLELQNERISTMRQLRETKSKQTVSTLEPVKEVFLRASRAKKEFLEGDDTKKHTILQSLLWNLSLKDKIMASVSLKSPYDIMSKAPKNGGFSTKLRDLDSNQDNDLQRVASYR